MAIAKKTPGMLDIPPMNLKRMTLTLRGVSPLIMHKWSAKAKTEMRDKQMQAAKQKKGAKVPVDDFIESMYWLEGEPIKTPMNQDLPDILAAGRYGFPTIAFKASAVDACTQISGIAKTEARGAFHIYGELVEIVGKPVMREDMVRIGMGTADLRYRGEFRDWSATITITYNANMLSPAQIANLFQVAGFAVGVGEWRPSKDGSNGRFEVDMSSIICE